MLQLKKTTLAAVIVAAGGIGFASMPASALPPVNYTYNHEQAPRIDDFDVISVRDIEPGSPLRFVLRGTPGARATVSIDGTIRSLLLSEVRTGVYRGTYVVASRDRIPNNARVVARLTKGNYISTAHLGESLVDTNVVVAPRAPTIANVAVAEEDRRGRGWMRFSMNGTPGGQATVQFTADQPYALTLDEVRPGEYSAVYRLERGTAIDTNRPLQARLKIGERVAATTVTGAFNGLSERTLARMGRQCDDCGVVEVVRRVERGYGNVDFEVVVRTDDGRQVVTYDGLPPFQVGDEVRVVGNTLERRQG